MFVKYRRLVPVTKATNTESKQATLTFVSKADVKEQISRAWHLNHLGRAHGENEPKTKTSKP